MFYIICYLASQWAVLNYLCGSERQNGWCQLKWRVSSSLWSVKKHRGVFSSKKKNEYNISWDYLMEWSCLQYSAAGWMFCSSFNANFEDTQASTFVALLCCLRSHTCPVAEGSPSVLWGVCTAAGEGAGAGPAEGGRVSVCPQGHARQDPGHGEGGFPWAWCTADFNQHPVLLYDL